MRSVNERQKERAELKSSPVGEILFKTSRIPKIRRLCLLLSLRLEGNGFYSFTARRIMSARYGVAIGSYSYGGCFVPGDFPPGVGIGRYVSIAHGICILRRNHPLDRVSTHPFFFNSKLGFVPEDHAPYKSLTIEHDAWLGERVTITPGCIRIGIGAVVGASAVVTKDVPDFAVVGGNPARIIKFRFPEEQRRDLLETRWWEKSIGELSRDLSVMCAPLITVTSPTTAPAL